MERLKCFIKNLKRRSRLLLENKRTAGVLLVSSMLLTIVSVRFLRPLWERVDNEESPEPLITKLLEGKRAVSLVIGANNVPLDVLYPGANVDVTDIRQGELVYLARNVAVAGLSIIDGGSYAKVTLAMDLEDSENIIKNRSDTVSLILSNGNNMNKDIEIVEM